MPSPLLVRPFRLSRVLLGAAVAVLMTCATPQTMQRSDATPAGQGTLQVDEAANGSLAYVVKVKHLAPAARVAEDATVYVVWVQQRNHPPQNAGELSIDSNLEGSFSNVTPLRRFMVMVTPEPSVQVRQPSHDPVFSSEVDRVN